MKIVKDTYDQLYKHQKKGVKFLKNKRAALLADDVGTGKTVQAIHASIAVGARSVLIICSASIKWNWRRELIKWGVDPDCITIVNKDNVQECKGEGVFIINYDRIWRKNYAKVLMKREYDVLICDECHALKNHKAKRSKAVWLKNGYCDRSIYRWMLSATPVLNRPEELHAMLYKLCPNRLGKFLNYIAYTKRYCNGKEGNWGWDASGATNLDELSGRLDGFMLRRTRDELPEIGEISLQKVYMPFTKNIEKTMFSGEESDSMRRMIGIAKVTDCAKHIEDLLQSEEKIVVFAYHIDVIKGLKKKLKKYKPAVIRGATSSRQRENALVRFTSAPDCRLFIGQIDAAGEGIDGLQHAASLGVFVEISHTPGRMKQAIGRLYREGQKHKCLFQFLMVEGTVDDQILGSTILKEKNIQTVLKDDERTLDFEKRSTEYQSVKTQTKEEVMSMEKELKRIADSLEKLVKLKNETVIKWVQTDVQEPEPAPKREPAKSVPEVQEESTKEDLKTAGPLKVENMDRDQIKEELDKRGIEYNKKSHTPTLRELLEEQEEGPVNEEKPVKVEAKPEEPPKDLEPEIVDGDEYQEEMRSIANKISDFTGDPKKTSDIFAELNERFHKEFPNSAHVFDVDPEDYGTVRKIVRGFLKEKGIE